MANIAQAQEKGIVIGLNSVSSAPVPRLDIEELLLDHPDAFNLFLLALQALQDEKETKNKMGYYQMAGIHGLPRALWDGVDNDNKDPKKPWTGEGYCAHGVPTFPTWHRPYLAMYEQSLYSKMTEIAERYPEKAKPKYRAALKEFRLPYWDYYRPRNKGTTKFSGVKSGGTTTFDYDFAIPQIFTVERVMVARTSDDKLESIENPLNRFVFPTTGGLTEGFEGSDWTLAEGEGDFSKKRTVRYPTKVGDIKGSVIDLNAKLNKQRESRLLNILDMIENRVYGNYATFASSSRTPGPSGSLEAIHGAYHLNIGGTSGHMSSVPIAAFDPVFWIHHCQIDRWFAIWQAANPGKWFDGSIKSRAETPALPFRHPQGTTKSPYWNANLAQETKTFGYTYKDALGTADKVKGDFKKLYEWSTRPGGRPIGVVPDAMIPLEILEAQVFQYPPVDSTTNVIREVLNKGPQLAMRVVETATTAATSAATKANAPETTATGASAPVDTKPATPGSTTSGVAFTNMPASTVDAAPKSVDESKYYRDWYVDNIVERMALNGSFTIYYFIGDFTQDNVRDYALQPTMAGLNHVFTSTREACDNCGFQMDEGHLVTDTNPITPMLLDYIEIGQLADLTPANVVPFLIKNLKWRVVTVTGQQVNPRQVAGLKVGVSSKLTPRDGGDLAYEEYPQVVEEIIANAS